MKCFKKILFFSTLFLFVYFFSVSNNIADRDLWHRLAAGILFFQTGSVIKHDIFAYTPTKSMWIDHEWGAGVIFYYLSHFFGDYGLLGIKIISFFIVLLLVYQINKLINKEEDRYRIGFYILSAFAMASGFSSCVRSQIFTYVFFTLWIYLLERIRRGENRLIWIFPATMLLWTNLHGGFVAGLGLIGIYAFGELLNRKNPLKYFGILAITIPVTLINPYGINFWPYMFEAATMPRPYITEWRPFNIFSPFNVFMGVKILSLMTFFGLGFKFIYNIFSNFKAKKPLNFEFLKSVDWTGILVILVTLALALKHQRHLIFFAITASIFGYKYFFSSMNILFDRYIKRIKNFFTLKQLNLINFTKEITVYSLFLSLTINACSKTPLNIPVPDGFYPVSAIEFIRINKLSGNLLTPFNWGSYALWKLYPQCLISIDGRYEETYPNNVYKEITDFTFFNKNWSAALEKYKTDIVLLQANSATYNKFKTLKKWKIIYKDKHSAIFIPASYPDKKWSFPDKNNDYSNTKYLNNINFN